MSTTLQITEELDEELEALGRKFPSVQLQDASNPVTASLVVTPGDSPKFSTLTVTATFPPAYPTSAVAEVALSNIRGAISPADVASLRATLKEATQSAAGSAHVLDAFRTVSQFVNDHNSPPDCPWCSKSVTGAPCIALSPCLHPIHAGPCWTSWYTEQARLRREKEARHTGELGSLEAERFAMQGWPACPTCGHGIEDGKARADASAALVESSTFVDICS